MHSSKTDGIRTLIEIEKIALPGKLDSFVITNPFSFAASLIFSNENIRGKKLRLKSPPAISLEKFRKISEILERFGFAEVEIPVEEILVDEEGFRGFEVLSEFVTEGKRLPAILKKDNKVIFLFDLGKCFIKLVNETYFSKSEKRHGLANPLSEWVYKKLPYRLRLALYRRYYKRLHAKIPSLKSFKTKFPIDPAGFVLVELLRESMLLTTGIAKISRWPYGHNSASILTHDIEPTDYSYEKGLVQLIAELRNAGQKSTINLVAACLEKSPIGVRSELKSHDIGCHGLYHDRKFMAIGSRERKYRIAEAKKIIERAEGKKVQGFRAPALQRTSDLFELLEETGFKFDSSFIDVQREEPFCGRGNSFYLPFHPLMGERKSRILELTTTAPDCISPYFFGMSIDETISLFKKKAEWLRAIGGLAVFIVHAPVWGGQDENRLRLLSELLPEMRKERTWNATAFEIYNWWKARENVSIRIEKGKIIIENWNDFDMERLELLVEDKFRKTSYMIPPVKANGSYELKLGAK